MAYIGVFIFFLTIISLGQAKPKRSVEEFFKREKCIDELGCFNAGSPFFDIIERPASLLPDDRAAINTNFQLFTPQNGQKYSNFSNLDHSINDLLESGFNPKATTKFIIPGFMSKFASYWKMPLIEALLYTEMCNVFLVDWQGGDGPLYEQAVANTRVVGAEIALFIKNIQTRTRIPLDSIHLIGHSLGSHIAGYAGKRLNKLGRITALDPAGPYFTNVDPIVRLDKSDALFVDAIHTNAAPSRFQGFGLTNSIAHLDFWPNGGHLQPGCPDMGSAVWSFLSHLTLDYDGLHDIMCNHGRAIDLFISSIKHPECEMLGVVCDSLETYRNGKCEKCADDYSNCFIMGVHADEHANYIKNDKSLNIFLDTTDTEPFCEK